jgi:hypothetical protein
LQDAVGVREAPEERGEEEEGAEEVGEGGVGAVVGFCGLFLGGGLVGFLGFLEDMPYGFGFGD